MCLQSLQEYWETLYKLRVWWRSWQNWESLFFSPAYPENPFFSTFQLTRRITPFRLSNLPVESLFFDFPTYPENHFFSTFQLTRRITFFDFPAYPENPIFTLSNSWPIPRIRLPSLYYLPGSSAFPKFSLCHRIKFVKTSAAPLRSNHSSPSLPCWALSNFLATNIL